MPDISQSRIDPEKVEAARIWDSKVIGAPVATPETKTLGARFDGTQFCIRSDALAVVQNSYPGCESVQNVFAILTTFSSQLLKLPDWSVEDAQNAGRELRRVLEEYSPAIQKELAEKDKARYWN